MSADTRNDLLIYGDPHGDWLPLVDACAKDPPSAVVILGDCDLTAPLRTQIKPVFDQGIRVRWIPGNHDKDTPEWHDRLWGDYPEGNLHARSAYLGGLAVAGLGGIFKEEVYFPRIAGCSPAYATRDELLRRLHPSDRWRGGLPLSLRDAIFPEDIEALQGLNVQVLLTHEAPSSHRYGFFGIDKAAALCGASLIVHGHHHETYESRLPNGVRVCGVGRAGVLRLNAQDWA